MVISIREVVSDTATGATAQVTTGAGTADGDLLLALGFTDFHELASGFGPPSPGSWTTAVTVDRGTDDSKIRAWWREGDAGGGPQTVGLDPISDEDILLVVLVLAGVDLAAPTDGADGALSAAATPSVHTAPSISPTTADALLVCAVVTQVFGDDGSGNYSPPGGMSEQIDETLNGFARGAVATEQLASSGATGVRDFGYVFDNVAGAAISLAIRTQAADTFAPPFNKSRPNRIWRTFRR